MTTELEQFVQDPEAMRLFQQERAIIEFTQRICELMKKDGVSRADLAKLMNKSRSYISQLLDGETNMTIRTISDAFTALGYELHPAEERISIGGESEGVVVCSQTFEWPKAAAAASYEIHVVSAN